MNPAWRYAAVALLAGVAALLWPLTDALSARDALQPRLACAAVAAIVCAVLARVTGVRPRLWIGLSLLSGAIGVTLLLEHFNAATACVAEYDGRPVIIGRTYTQDVEVYVRENPGLSPSDRLFDAGGVPERVWSPESIRTCRLLVSWGGLAAIPFFATCAAALLSSGRHVLLAGPRRTRAVAARGPIGRSIYDAFVSYRHVEPDNTHAIGVAEALQARGLRVAVDFRDFSPNEHFLSEMERCIKESRFVLCIVTSQYLESDHTSEEAILSKTLDMAERRKRLVPLVFERVELPVWLHGLVGIDFTPSARVDPYERLFHLLAPQSLPGAPSSPFEE